MPHTPEIPDSLHAEVGNYYPTQLSRETAHFLYTDIADTEVHILKLYYDLDQYCMRRDLDSEDPGMQNVINRAIYAATSAPFYHMIELEADRLFLAAMVDDSLSLSRLADIVGRQQPFYPFEGEYLRLVELTGALDNTAAQTVVEPIAADAHHPYRPLWELFTVAHQAFAETDKHMRGWERPADPAEELIRTATGVTEETVLRMLMERTLHLNVNEGYYGSCLSQRLMHDVDELTRHSLGKRGFGASAFPFAGERANTTPACPFMLGRTTVFAARGDERVWARDAMQFDPEIPGFCPTPELMAPSEEGRLIVEKMRDVRMVYAGSSSWRSKCIPGLASSAELHMIRDIVLLGQTVVKTL